MRIVNSLISLSVAIVAAFASACAYAQATNRATPAPVPVAPVGVILRGPLPLPVSVVQATEPNQVICHLDVLPGGVNSTLPYIVFRRAQQAALACTPNATGIDVRRAIASPNAADGSIGDSSINLISYQMLVGVGPSGAENMTSATALIGLFSMGDLDKTLSSPVRIDAGTDVIVQGACGGIAGLPIKCALSLWLIGTPAATQ